VADKRFVLRRNKAIAGGLMVAAGILFVIARIQKGSGAWEWVAAFSEAAMIGALADWFAVVALFRHPLGVPIPHTAIIPGKKEAIADSLAEFIRDKFLATEALVEKLKSLNPAERLAAFLSVESNADTVARGVSRVLADSLDFVDDDRVRKILRAALHDRIGKMDLSSCAALLLDFLRRDNRHQAVLDEALKRLATWSSLPESREKIAVAVGKWCEKEYPLLMKFIPNREQFLAGAGEKIAGRINEFIQDVNADPGHELRRGFNDAIDEFIARLKDDPLLRARVDEIKHELLSNPRLSDYLHGLWSELKAWLRDDLDRNTSRVRTRISECALGLGASLAKSSDLKDSINEHLETMVRRYADGLRLGFAKHISGTIKQWEDKDFVSEIELSIGSDLQFIRMNGTLVGGLIGLLLHAATLIFL
jgi:uncharacterized membrane-anchored protein YjiN (DUF445 family)